MSKILVLRTDIKTRKKVKAVRPLFDNHPVIREWSIDTKDIDNVLRIEASDRLTEQEIVHLVRSHGFACEELPD